MSFVLVLATDLNNILSVKLKLNPMIEAHTFLITSSYYENLEEPCYIAIHPLKARAHTSAKVPPDYK